MLKLVTPYKQFKSDVLSRCADELNRRAKSNVSKCETKIKNVVNEELNHDSVIVSLMSSRSPLRMELGIPDTGAVTTLVNTIVESIKLKYQSLYVIGNKYSGPLVVLSSITADDLVNDSRFSFLSENGHKVDWLRWLLEMGDSAIIYGYFYRPANRYELYHGYSRAGGIMREGQSRSWGVPSEYSGTSNDNFLTRTISRTEQKIIGILNEVLH